MSKRGVELTPKFPDTFRAFRECPFEKLHTVILGMDPYPGKVDKSTYVADGIAFSSRDSKTCPKSLNYILEAIDRDVFNLEGYDLTKSFDLTKWANQGILLLNCALTLPLKEKSGAHIELWSTFIAYVLQEINARKDGVGVILMGSHAKAYRRLLTNGTFGVYSCEHPSRANYTGKWEDEGVFKSLVGYHKFLNNIQIDW